MGMIVSKSIDSKPNKLSLKKQGYEYVIKFWEEDLTPEFDKIQVNAPYCMIGLHQKKFKPTNSGIEFFSFTYTKQSIALLIKKN